MNVTDRRPTNRQTDRHTDGHVAYLEQSVEECFIHVLNIAHALRDGAFADEVLPAEYCYEKDENRNYPGQRHHYQNLEKTNPERDPAVTSRLWRNRKVSDLRSRGLLSSV